jgi:hypothetical protein
MLADKQVRTNEHFCRPTTRRKIEEINTLVVTVDLKATCWHGPPLGPGLVLRGTLGRTPAWAAAGSSWAESTQFRGSFSISRFCRASQRRAYLQKRFFLHYNAEAGGAGHRHFSSGAKLLTETSRRAGSPTPPMRGQPESESNQPWES